jgi:hypothetical protein
VTVQVGPSEVKVVLLNMPIEAFRESSSHHDELFREFVLAMSGGGLDIVDVPDRLRRVMEDVEANFRGPLMATRTQLDEATMRGEDALDVIYTVDRSARRASLHLIELLDLADEYCRKGKLLTLASDSEAVRFRNWYLHEFVRQIDGYEPTPWQAVAV